MTAPLAGQDPHEPSSGPEPASWRQEGLPVDAVSIADGRVYWIEGRAEGDVLLAWSAGKVTEALPAGTHVASEVHEYGGGAYLVADGEIWFVRAEDQRIGAPTTAPSARSHRNHPTDNIDTLTCTSVLTVSWYAYGSATRIDLPYTSIKPYLVAGHGQLALIGSAPTHTPTVALVEPCTAHIEELTPPTPTHHGITAEQLRFPTRDNSNAHAVLYQADPSTAPAPLLVRAHPGPTSNTNLRLDPWISFFTGHGYAVLDVDYRGSTGYGRTYRNALRRHWGDRDVADCVDAVHYRHLGRLGPKVPGPPRGAAHGTAIGPDHLRRAFCALAHRLHRSPGTDHSR